MGIELQIFPKKIKITNSFIFEFLGLQDGLLLCCSCNIVAIAVELDARSIVDVLCNYFYVNNVVSPILDDCW